MPLSGSHQWTNPPSDINQRKYTCGHFGCHREVGSNKGWFYHNPNTNRNDGFIYLCPICHRPTFFDQVDNLQIPNVNFGNPVQHLPEDVKKIYDEIRSATGVNSYTLAILGCRKILMHIAVEKGAAVGLGFIDYVKYLVDNHYAPPGSQPWVDKIRQVGNEANHEIKISGQEETVELINFVEMLLKFIYEFPAKINVQSQAATS